MGNVCSFNEGDVLDQSKIKPLKRSNSDTSKVTASNTRKLLSGCLILKIGRIQLNKGMLKEVLKKFDNDDSQV